MEPSSPNSFTRAPCYEIIVLRQLLFENQAVAVNHRTAETLSNLAGKWIKRIGKDKVEFTNGTKINTKDLDYKLIESLIWWE